MALAALAAGCGSSSNPAGPTSVPPANIVSAGALTWGYRVGDGFSAFSGQVQNTGMGCAGPTASGDISGVATLYNGGTVISSGNYLVAVNSVTRVIKPGEVVGYSGSFIPAVPPGTVVTNSTLSVNFVSVSCPP